MTAKDQRGTILVVDDVAETVEVISRNLSSQGFQVATASSVTQAVNFLQSCSVDLVITDLKMPKASGLDLVRYVCENLKDTEVVIITGYPSLESAVTAVRIGAENYLAKPFTDAELLAAVKRAMGKVHARRLGNAPSDHGPGQYGIIGNSPAIRKVFRAIGKAAKASATVLICGESGTGKELVARAVHYSSSRASNLFLPVNCGSIPESLLESELFGYVKGAFTGATESRAGFFQTADGGTIFLDEISETSLNMQVKLLRVLEDKHVYMVGSSRPRQVNIRVLASSNKDLVALSKTGLFREDLYYRLNVVKINLPPLRERGDDILLLAHHFAAKFSKELGKPVPRFSDQALRALKGGYHWPGNVRELENTIHSVVVMSEDENIDVSDLPPSMRFTYSQETDLTRTLAEVEADYVSRVLASVSGNRTKAAKILGIDRKTLREKLR